MKRFFTKINEANLNFTDVKPTYRNLSASNILKQDFMILLVQVTQLFLMNLLYVYRFLKFNIQAIYSIIFALIGMLIGILYGSFNLLSKGLKIFWRYFKMKRLENDIKFLNKKIKEKPWRKDLIEDKNERMKKLFDMPSIY